MNLSPPISTAGSHEPPAAADDPAHRVIRIGIIGLDSTHAVEFSRRLNAAQSPTRGVSIRVVAACVGAPTDLALSVNRRAGVERQMREELSIPVIPALRELVEAVDAVMILSCDGRCHRPEAMEALTGGKPLFIDKPLSADWRDAVHILQQAHLRKIPCFSGSALRFRSGLAEVKNRPRARPLHLDVIVPKLSQAGHPDLLWHGIHGIESAYALLGPGCVAVQRHQDAQEDLTTGHWPDGSTVRIRRSDAREAAEFPMRIVANQEETHLTGFDYTTLLAVVSHFLRTGQTPVAAHETVETLAFAAASAASRHRGGALIDLPGYMARREFDL